MALIQLNSTCIDFPVLNSHKRQIKNKFVRSVTGGRVKHLNRGKINVVALDNINLTIKPGERIGLIGHNGAGKTTLLKTIAGIYEPTRGEIVVNGAVSTLLSLHQGMENDLTGMDNLISNLKLRDFNQKEIREKMDYIVEFSELGDYLNMPIRTYSHGMIVRLGFALSTLVDASIFVLDECFVAGDAHFYKKSLAKIESLAKQAKIFVIASHVKLIHETFCNKLVWLDAGKIRMTGTVDEVHNAYYESLEQC